MSVPNCYLFDPQYAKIQQLKGYKLFVSDIGIFPVVIQSQIVTSLPKSPFGGLLVDNVNKQKLFHWLDEIIKDLKTKSNELVIKHPGSIYPTTNDSWLQAYGFQQTTTEIAHYIDLNNFTLDRLHSMQQRKLKSSQFSLEVVSLSKLSDMHSFIADCRARQGLEINISLDSLTKQVEAFQDRFLFFVAKKDHELAAACIITLPLDNIAYYYLPATNPKYKKDSPMVSLMVFIYDQLNSLGYDYLDLGISSIEGRPQTSLITFKERMGGIYYPKSTYSLDLTTDR